MSWLLRVSLLKLAPVATPFTESKWFPCIRYIVSGLSFSITTIMQEPSWNCIHFTASIVALLFLPFIYIICPSRKQRVVFTFNSRKINNSLHSLPYKAILNQSDICLFFAMIFNKDTCALKYKSIGTLLQCSSMKTRWLTTSCTGTQCIAYVSNCDTLCLLCRPLHCTHIIAYCTERADAYSPLIYIYRQKAVPSYQGYNSALTCILLMSLVGITLLSLAIWQREVLDIILARRYWSMIQ